MRFVYILRGIPGSGKSTVAQQLARKTDEPAVIHSTDDLCMVDGEYQFDIELAGERHAQNLENFIGSLDKRVPCVIVDNTNVKVEQYAPYVESAQTAGYAVVFVEVAHPDLDVAVARNTHGVSEEIINKMILDWEPSQHSAIIENVNEAAVILEVLQAREQFVLWLGFTAGSVIGSATIALAWALWPS